jgi:four helix bundle protein
MKGKNQEIRHSHHSLVPSLPRTYEARLIGNQVLRSGTSMAANYRAACRARSRAEFLSKLGIAVEEADETVFRLELMTEAGTTSPNHTHDLLKEANELLAIFAASQVTVRANSDGQI